MKNSLSEIYKKYDLIMGSYRKKYATFNDVTADIIALIEKEYVPKNKVVLLDNRLPSNMMYGMDRDEYLKHDGYIKKSEVESLIPKSITLFGRRNKCYNDLFDFMRGWNA